MNIVRNYKLFRVQSLCRKQEYKKALDLARRLLFQTPDSVVVNTVLADVLLFSNDIEKAMSQYEITGRILEVKDMDVQDQRYLTAYINSRMLALKYKRAGKPFQNAMELASIVNKLEAHNNLKRLFPLPE